MLGELGFVTGGPELAASSVRDAITIADSVFFSLSQMVNKETKGEKKK